MISHLNTSMLLVLQFSWCITSGTRTVNISLREMSHDRNRIRFVEKLSRQLMVSEDCYDETMALNQHEDIVDPMETIQILLQSNRAEYISKYCNISIEGRNSLDCNFEEHYSHHDVKTSCTNSGGHYTAYNVVASGDRDGIPIDISLKNMPFCMGLNCEDVKSIIPDESSSLNGIDSLSIEARSSSDSDTIGPTTNNVDDASTRIIAKSFFLLHSTIALFLFW